MKDLIALLGHLILPSTNYCTDSLNQRIAILGFSSMSVFTRAPTLGQLCVRPWRHICQLYSCLPARDYKLLSCLRRSCQMSAQSAAQISLSLACLKATTLLLPKAAGIKRHVSSSFTVNESQIVTSVLGTASRNFLIQTSSIAGSLFGDLTFLVRQCLIHLGSSTCPHPDLRRRLRPTVHHNLPWWYRLLPRAELGHQDSLVLVSLANKLAVEGDIVTANACPNTVRPAVSRLSDIAQRPSITNPLLLPSILSLLQHIRLNQPAPLLLPLSPALWPVLPSLMRALWAVWLMHRTH